MNNNLVASSSSSGRHHQSHMKHSNYGIESISTITSQLDHDSDDSVDKARRSWKQGLIRKEASNEELSSAYSHSTKSSVYDSRNVSPSQQRRRRPSQTQPSLTITPTYLDSPILASSPSFQHSRNSSADFLTDDSVLLSSADDAPAATRSPLQAPADSSSQLVMPCLTLPSRRPFTDKGRAMGRLKITVCGDSGTGKTSLIKSIVQTSPDIIHVDEVPMESLPSPTLRKRKTRRSMNDRSPVPSTTKLVGVYASTKPYPTWYSSSSSSSPSSSSSSSSILLNRRRSSVSDTVLDRNVCFVDTPGLSTGEGAMSTIQPVISYIETQYTKTIKAEMSDSELVGLLSGVGASLVDVVLYLFHKRVKPVDIGYLQRLSTLTNIVPLIACSDSYTASELSDFRQQIISELHRAGIKITNLDLSNPASHPCTASTHPVPPYAVSSCLSSDEKMDASTLMDPSYLPPLVSSDLPKLVEKLFEPETMAYLRHTAALRCVKRFKSSPSSSHGASSGKSQSVPYALSPAGPSWGLTRGLNNHALVRIADHTQLEENLAKARLSNWALDLQRSQANERRRFEKGMRNGQLTWHAEQLVNLAGEGEKALSTGQSGEFCGELVQQFGVQRGVYEVGGKVVDRQDPLNILHLTEDIKGKTWATLRIVSSVGVIGAVVFWVARFARDWHLHEQGVVGWEWGRLMGDW